jgi:hypothetical protein
MLFSAMKIAEQWQNVSNIIMIVSVIILSTFKRTYQSVLFQYQFDNISKPVDKVHRRIKVFGGYHSVICFLGHIRH